MKDNGKKIFTATAEEREDVDQKFKTLLDDAVGFFNAKAGKKLRGGDSKNSMCICAFGVGVRLSGAQLAARS